MEKFIVRRNESESPPLELSRDEMALIKLYRRVSQIAVLTV
jgi:hypothetical protein